METTTFKRMNANSKLYFISKSNLDFDNNFFGLGAIIGDIQNIENDAKMILQIYFNPILPTEDCDLVAIIEYIDRPQQQPSDHRVETGDIDFENYLDTTINKDPFGGKYSGRKIREVFENGDAQWLNTALKELRNEFLRDRLQYIVDRGGYGKILC